MNFPQATPSAKVTLEKPDTPKLALQFYKLEDKPGSWVLNKRIRSQQSFSNPSDDKNVIAVFSEKGGFAFGEFMPADNETGVERLKAYGLAFAESTVEVSKLVEAAQKKDAEDKDGEVKLGGGEIKQPQEEEKAPNPTAERETGPLLSTQEPKGKTPLLPKEKKTTKSKK